MGLLRYFENSVRLYIEFGVGNLSSFTISLDLDNRTSIEWVLRYLKGTNDKEIYYEPASYFQLQCCSDSEFLVIFRTKTLQNCMCYRRISFLLQKSYNRSSFNHPIVYINIYLLESRRIVYIYT